ncbi:DUF3224 domain-containing protein [Actinomycetospora cinnamomea]|uniref:Uncharacterized protein DUF3224 n=1 Tax=Actinomycetospora cinnamomea TaxID=663609 RepID=A0A2U1F672_9PSEU|nr:DUF3224 domain-containing protein [Actinomycetospora cinnamomea]PVZ07683.1 uncharacterized protein DUF3224 [Actinomycetospora cinnamomea]
MTHLESPFRIDGWDAADTDPLADPDGAGPATGRAVVRKTYTGDLAATSVADLLTCQGEDGAAYLASERIVGELGGRRGSFVLQHGAAGGAGAEPQQWAFVVPGSGTGELAGLRGTGVLAHERITLDYELG